MLCVETRAVGIDSEKPAQVWEWWDERNKWQRVLVLVDETKGFNVQGEGNLRLALPDGLKRRPVDGLSLYWIRCRYTRAEADFPNAELRPKVDYQQSPLIRAVFCRSVGVSVPASHTALVRGEELGRCEGGPGQTFSFRNPPILPLQKGEPLVLWIGPKNIDWFWDREDTKIPLGWEIWEETENFASCGPEDKRFVCDYVAGEVRFGPYTTTPDGAGAQFGALPTRGHTVICPAYRVGGGTRGNIAAGKITRLASAYDGISQVTNPSPAVGGQESETLEYAKLRAQREIRRQERAVTASDFEELTEQKLKNCRARCVTPETKSVPTGEVQILVVPPLPKA